MEKTIQRICGLLQSSDGMRRCAAAIVLGDLGLKHGAIVTALADTLKNGSPLLTRYVLEAFEAIGTRAVVPHVLPLLESDDMEIKMRAAGIVARAGGEMLSVLEKQFQLASPLQKRVLMDIVARIHSRAAMRLILDTLYDPDFELVKEACQAVRRHISTATPQERKTLHKQVAAFMRNAAVRKNERVLNSCLLLVGYIGAPDALKVLLKHAGPGNPSLIRRYALVGLKGVECTGPSVGQMARTMVGYLNDPDYANVVQNALDIVERLPLQPSFVSQWRKLLKNRHPNVRAFAVRKLAALDNAVVNKLLVTWLDHPDTQVGEIAAGALARHKGATSLLLAMLARERKTEKVWRLARILKPHSDRIDKKTLRKCASLAAKALVNDDPRHEAYFYFLRNVDAATADGVMRDVGLRFKKAKKWNRAVQYLRQLSATDLVDAQLRYDLSICHLKQSTKELGAQVRSDDHALRGFQALLPDRRFALFERLVKDKALGADDLYYVGFHFAESTGDERKFGLRLLEHIAKRWPSSKMGKAAKNKLKLTAQAEAP